MLCGLLILLEIIFGNLVGPSDSSRQWSPSFVGDSLEYNGKNFAALKDKDVILDRERVIPKEYYDDYSFKANATFDSILSDLTGNQIFNVPVEIDSHGRRAVPQYFIEADKFILFLGGSFVFGEGVSQEQTLPAQITQKIKNTRGYILANPGGNPSELLFRTWRKGRPWLQGINEKKGVAIYVHIDEHIYRTAPSMRYYLTNPWIKWNRKFLFKRNDGSNRKFIRMAQFYSQRFWIFDLLGQSHLLKYFNFDWPIDQFNDENIIEFIRLLKSVKSRLLQNVEGLEDFYVVNYPGNFKFTKYLRKPLVREGLKVIDLGEINLANALSGRNQIPFDGHPSPSAYKYLAEIIANQIERP